mgnify:FL=1
MRGSNNSTKVLFIGNIDSKVTEDDLMLLFQNSTYVRLKYDRETLKPLGYGFVEFKDSESVTIAIEKFSNYFLKGKVIKLSRSY